MVTLLHVFLQPIDVGDIVDGPILQQDLDQLVCLERLRLDPLLVVAVSLLLSDLGRPRNATRGLVFSQGIVLARRERKGFQLHITNFWLLLTEGSLWDVGEYPRLKIDTFMRPRPH